MRIMRIAAYVLAIPAAVALMFVFSAREAPEGPAINPCRSDAELAALPDDHMSQQRCADAPLFSGW